MSNRFLVALIVLLAGLLVGLGLFWKPDLAPAPASINTLPPGGDFVLKSADGPVALADHRGRLALLYFGYTFCPDICPSNLSAISAGLDLLNPEERNKVVVIFISVDPQRDTPEHLKTYVKFFAPEMLGVTGTPDEIAELARRYGVVYAAQPASNAAEGYAIDHSAESFIVGPDGRLLARMAHATPPDQVAALIRQYLKPS